MKTKMDKDKLIGGVIKCVLAFGLTIFLIIKGWVQSYENIEIDGHKVTFYRVYEVDEDPHENFFFKKRLYKKNEVRAFVNSIGASMYFLNEEFQICDEDESSYVAVRLNDDKTK